MGTSPRTGLVTQPTQPEFFNQSQLVLSRLLFISHRFSLHGTLAPRDIGTPSRSTGRWNLGTLELVVSVYLSRSTPRLISTFSQFRDVVSNFVHTAARGTFLTRRGAAAKQTPLTRRGAAARSTPLTAPVVAILTWADRGHHVPALTVTSGGRGVGFDMHAWGRLSISHSRRHLNPRASSFSCFSFLLPLRPLGLGFSPGRASGICVFIRDEAQGDLSTRVKVLNMDWYASCTSARSRTPLSCCQAAQCVPGGF